MLIRARNLLDQQSPYTYLSTSGTVGASTFPVDNINAFQSSWAIQFGKTGEETAEVLIISQSTPSGTTLTTTGTARFTHPLDTPVFAVKYDKVIFKRSTSGTAGTATAFSNSTVTITPDAYYTQVDDPTALTTYAYKACFFNSVSGELSTDSDWITSSGYSFYSLAKIRDRVKRKLYSSGYIKDDLTIDDWINEWLENMNNVLIDVNRDYALGSTNVAFSGTTELGTITASDFKEVRRVWFTYNGTDYYLARRMNLTGYIPQDTFTTTHPYFYYAGDNVIGRKPIDSSATASIEYYKNQTVLTNDTDELPVAMHAYSKSFVDYALGQAYYMDLKPQQGAEFDAKSNASLEKFRAEITPRSKTGPVTINVTEAIDGDDDLELVI